MSSQCQRDIISLFMRISWRYRVWWAHAYLYSNIPSCPGEHRVWMARVVRWAVMLWPRGERSVSVCGRLISLLDPNSPSASVWDVPQSTIRGRFVYPHFHWAVRAVPVEKVILEAALNCMRPPSDRLGMPLPSFAIKFLNGLKKLMHLSHCLHSKKRIIDWKNWVQRMPPLLLPHKPQKHHRHLLFRKGRCAVPKANATGSDGALGPVSGNWKTKPGKKVGNTENANRGLACFLNPLNGN